MVTTDVRIYTGQMSPLLVTKHSGFMMTGELGPQWTQLVIIPV